MTDDDRGPPRVWNVAAGNFPRDAVYIGRGSKYGNPYLIGWHGTRDEVCDRFERHILPSLDVSALRGCDLLCHCAPARCHGDSILKKANAPALKSIVENLAINVCEPHE